MKRKTLQYPPHTTQEPAVLKEVAALPGVGAVISVRSAKAHLSALLEMVSEGQSITITSDGRPKAVLAPVESSRKRGAFTGTRAHLKSMPPWRGGVTAEETIRQDRDGRD